MAGIALNIYLTKSEKTALSKVLTDKIELTGTLRDPSDILNPSIEIQASAQTIAARNYFDIPAFGRKYFITEITSDSYGLVTIHGHVDVLSTYETEIRTKNAGIVGRSASRYNLFFDDNTIKTDVKTKILTKNDFKNGGYFVDDPHIALVVVG